ncbi:MAG: hypothetical protein ABW133_00395 [Polyangiaceae bacterium]
MALAAFVVAVGTARSAAAEDTTAERSQSSKMPAETLWMGARGGLFVPYGALYADRSLVTTPFQDVATAGPAAEIDCGMRFARRFVGYAFFDHAFLGRGNSPAWVAAHGGQTSTTTEATGLGLRWESNPEAWGMVVDVAGGYRWFSSNWEDATTVRMGGFGDVRVGLGVTVRAAPNFTLTAMASIISGMFTSRTLDEQPLGGAASSYTASALALSGHIDVF